MTMRIDVDFENREVEVAFPRKFESIVCGHCGYEFIHIVVFREKMETWNAGNQSVTNIWEQVACNFCPRCGEQLVDRLVGNHHE